MNCKYVRVHEIKKMKEISSEIHSQEKSLKDERYTKNTNKYKSVLML